MSDPRIDRFHAYAAAFERAFETDDWSLLTPYFTDDATSELDGNRVAGREAVLTSFRTAVAMFDRRFDSRRMRITEGPTIDDGRVRIVAIVRYEREGLPALEVVGEEWFAFDGDRIARHVDRVLNLPEVMAYLGGNGEKLRPLATR